MADQDVNRSGSYGAAAQKRGQERQIEAAATGRTSPSNAAGRPRKRIDATQITLVISRADKEKVKMYALAHSLTVSDLLHQWIEQHCID